MSLFLYSVLPGLNCGSAKVLVFQKLIDSPMQIVNMFAEGIIEKVSSIQKDEKKQEIYLVRKSRRLEKSAIDKKHPIFEFLKTIPDAEVKELTNRLGKRNLIYCIICNI